MNLRRPLNDDCSVVFVSDADFKDYSVEHVTLHMTKWYTAGSEEHHTSTLVAVDEDLRVKYAVPTPCWRQATQRRSMMRGIVISYTRSVGMQISTFSVRHR